MTIISGFPTVLYTDTVLLHIVLPGAAYHIGKSSTEPYSFTQVCTEFYRAFLHLRVLPDWNATCFFSVFDYDTGVPDAVDNA